MNLKKFCFAIAIFLAAAFAQAQTLDGMYYDWSVYELKEPGRPKKCYIVSLPEESVGNYRDERQPYIIITRDSRRKTEEFAVTSGYPYKMNSAIYVLIDSKQFMLHTKDEMAWMRTPQDDKEIISALLKGQKIKVRGTSASGEYTIDDYSLKGIGRAYRRMKNLCKDDPV